MDHFKTKVEKLVKNYLGKDYTEEALDQIAEAVEYEMDAFRATKTLDDDGWSGDKALVDMMERIISIKEEALLEAIEKWVADNNIKADIAIGERVKFRSFGKEYTGEITNIYDKRAEYCIYCEQLGHVKSGNGSHGVIIPFERVATL
jgi:hypothetical protein